MSALLPLRRVRPATAGIDAGGRRGRRMSLSPRLRRALAALLLPASLIPVALLAPSLARAPATLWLRAERFVAPAHRAVRHREPSGPAYFLVGPARLELEVLRPGAGALTPQLGVSPLAEPGWAAVDASAPADRPTVLLALGRHVAVALGRHVAVAPIAVRRTARPHRAPARMLGKASGRGDRQR